MNVAAATLEARTRDATAQLPPGTVGIAVGDMIRYVDFGVSLMGVAAPPGSQVVMQQGISLVQNWNEICRSMTGDWLWMLADDAVFAHDTLLKLLRRDVDVVVPLCVKRSPPWQLVAYTHQEASGRYTPLDPAELPPSGLLEVHASGTMGMLIRKRVLDAIGDPWFTTTGEKQDEDLELCRKIRDAGFTIFVDTEQSVGHISRMTLWPTRNQQGEGGVGFDFGHDYHFALFRSGMTCSFPGMQGDS